jgi:RimJ/RimL family protein N-acetyltransferase
MGEKKVKGRFLNVDEHYYVNQTQTLEFHFKNATQTRIGSVHLQNISPTHKTCEINAQLVHPSYKNKLYGPELFIWALRIAFEWVELHKISGFVEQSNVASYRLCEQLGTLEGCFCERFAIFSLFKSDYDRIKHTNRLIQFYK